jgi:tetraacyldisaccharide 4'-kinase
MDIQQRRRYLKPLLVALSILYGLITLLRNRLFDAGILRSVEFGFPVISVGNITVGGTGKTPHVEYLIKLLHEKFNIAILSRGYKRKSKGFLIAGKGSTPDQIGDESFQIWQKFRNILVAVDEKRVRGIRLLKKHDPSLQCIVLDDAFQHRYVVAGVSILLIDYYRPLASDRMLPAGSLREYKQGIHRANIIIVTKVPHAIKPIEKRLWIKDLGLYPYQYLYFSSLRYGSLVPVFDRKQKKIILGELSDMKPNIILITGIANSQPLKEMLITCCSAIDHVCFHDHHEYSVNDLADIEKRYFNIPENHKLIITTEKDSVKIRNFDTINPLVKKAVYFIPVEVVLLDDRQKEFDANIVNYVTKNRTISRLHY